MQIIAKASKLAAAQGHVAKKKHARVHLEQLAGLDRCVLSAACSEDARGAYCLLPWHCTH